MSSLTRYREIEVNGPPRELGRQIGEAAREETRGFCEVALERVNKTVSVSRERAFDIARQSTEFAEKYRPDFVEVFRAWGRSRDDIAKIGMVPSRVIPSAHRR